MRRFEGRTVLITGAGSGIGAATARAALKAGDRVVATGRNLDKVRKALGEEAGANLAFDHKGVLVGVAVTVSRNPLLVVFVPSLTLTVIVADPVLPAAGVTVTVRLAPEPPNIIFAVGTSVVDDEVPETVRLAAAVSTSPIVNGIAAVAWPDVTDWAPMAVIVGAVFGAGA